MKTTTKTYRIIDLISIGIDHLNRAGIENSRREMEWFLCHLLDCKRIDLYLKFENILKENHIEKLRNMVKRRASGEPLQHIIGKAPFHGRDFIVNSHVFIPRPETGILINKLKENGKVLSLLDVGTGSGCIAITSALDNLSEKIYATDISSKALIVARENISLHKVVNIQIAAHDFLKSGFKTRFDVVISNPPYISTDEIDSLQVVVRDYDPRIALTDNADGYIFYRRFAERFDDLLNSGGYMLLEIGGNTHKEVVEKIFSDVGLKGTFYKDLQGDYRVAEIRK